MPMKQFNNIRRFREFKGYSQRYVAFKLKKSQSAFSKIENGITQVSDDTIKQLSEILEAPKDKLFTDEPLCILEMQKDNRKKILETKASSQLPVNEIVPVLFNQLLENKKLLREVQCNQEKLLQLLNMLFTTRTEKKLFASFHNF